MTTSIIQPTAHELLASWGEQLADVTVLEIIQAAVRGGRRGEIRLYWTNKGLAARPPAVYIDPTGMKEAA